MNVQERHDDTDETQVEFSKFLRTALIATMPCFLIVWMVCAALTSSFFVLMYGIFFVGAGGLIFFFVLAHAFLILADSPERRVRRNIVATLAGLGGLLVSACIFAVVAFSGPQ